MEADLLIGLVAILIYKTHDNMCRHGHPGHDQGKVKELYDEVLSANAQLQQLWHRRPDYLRAEAPLRPEWPSQVVHLRRAFAISFARSVSIRLILYLGIAKFSWTVFHHTPPFSVEKLQRRFVLCNESKHQAHIGASFHQLTRCLDILFSCSEK
jgi:hypothetical protein